MVFVDTGFLVALTSKQDGLHEPALAWSAALREPLLTSEYVLVETINALSVARLRRQVYAIWDEINAAPEWEIVPVSWPMFQEAIAFHRQHADKEWSLTDCVSFILMRQRRVSRALTYDRHFEQAGFEALLRRQP